MQAIKTILWVALAVLIVVFAMFNWVPATIRFWPGMVLETKLPVIVAIAFLLGSLPLWLAHRLTTWRLSKRIDHNERELEIYRSTNAPVPEAQPATPLSADPVAAAPSPTTADRDIEPTR